MDFVVAASRRRTKSGGYNPLADADHSGDMWVCTAEHGVKFFREEKLEGEAEKEVHVGAHIDARREGNVIQEKSSGLYAAINDKEGNRNFKNLRMMMLEKTNREDCNAHIEFKRDVSGESAKRGFSELGRKSFRWVDDAGESHRLEGDSEVLQAINQRPEVWVCIANHDVPHYCSASMDAPITGQDCRVGAKVNAVKEGEWLHVIVVKAHFDAGSTLGRRSFHAQSRLTVEDTGHYLPFSENGHKLFKNQKLMFFEESGKVGADVAGKKEDGSCAVM